MINSWISNLETSSQSEAVPAASNCRQRNSTEIHIGNQVVENTAEGATEGGYLLVPASVNHVSSVWQWASDGHLQDAAADDWQWLKWTGSAREVKRGGEVITYSTIQGTDSTIQGTDEEWRGESWSRFNTRCGRRGGVGGTNASVIH